MSFMVHPAINEIWRFILTIMRNGERQAVGFGLVKEKVILFRYLPAVSLLIQRLDPVVRLETPASSIHDWNRKRTSLSLSLSLQPPVN